MTTDTSMDSALLLTRSGIAALAGVRRPVVTVWADRYRIGGDPFPAPVQSVGGQDRFDGAEIVAWLTRRRLGNNDAVAEDLAVHAALDHRSDLEPGVVFEGITALLCLKWMMGAQLGDLDTEELLDEADEHDPDDEMVYSELIALGPELRTMALYVDRIADAAYTPLDAFEVLMRQRTRYPHLGSGPAGVAARASAMVAAVATSLADPDHATFVDPIPGGTDLLVAVRRRLPEYASPVAAVASDGGPVSRLARRRLTVHGWTLRRGGVADAAAVPDRAVFGMQYPVSSRAADSPVDVLTEIDDVTLRMGERHTAVVLAPARILVDPLRDAAASRVRSDILRSDRLRASIRLPEGLVPSAPGLPLALWVLGSADDSVPPAERRAVLADIGDIDLNEAVTSAIVSDVTAAMGSPASVRAHSFQFGELERTATLLAQDAHGALSGRRKRPRARVEGADIAVRAGVLVDRINRAATSTRSTVTMPLEYRSGGAARIRTVGDLVSEGVVRMVPGNRIDPDDVVADADHRVIGPDEVFGRCAVGSRGIDRLTFAADYPRGRFTVQGDIVVCGDADFGVLVDHEGAAVVLAPARVLRIVDPDAGLLPEVVAEYLRGAKTRTRPRQGVRTGARWGGWEVPQLRSDHAQATRAALEELARQRRAAAELVRNIDLLTTTVVDGLARGVLVVTDASTESTEEG